MSLKGGITGREAKGRVKYPYRSEGIETGEDVLSGRRRVVRAAGV
jgi:hypothetical protein